MSVVGGLLERRYRVDGLLARGGMSTVYRGVDTRLDRPVAIKIMDPRFSADRSFVDRFEREARAAARLHHPNVVAVHDQGVERTPEADHVFLVMELVDGGTLRDLLRHRGRLPVPLAFSVLAPVLSALAAAHQAGLVHRDIKPENVLIGSGRAAGPDASGADPGGSGPGGLGTVVKVGDFGLVRAAASAGTTSADIILGTVAYLSPEQVATGASDARSDVYSAGIVLYEMLTGQPPYLGDTAISVAYRHVNDDVPPPSELVEGLPPVVDDLVLRATRRDPAQRPADAAAFLAELRRVRDSLDIRPVPVPLPVPGHDEATLRVRLPARPDAGPAGGQDAAAAGTGSGPARPAAEATVPMLTPVRRPAGPLGPESPPRGGPALTPPGGPVGPQGTRAMSRSELPVAPAHDSQARDSQARDSQARDRQARDRQARHQAGRPVPARAHGHGTAGPAAEYTSQRRRSRRTFLVWVAIVLVLATLLGVSAWWLGSGRWTAVPKVTGLDEATAQQAVRDADLTPEVGRRFDNTVPAGTVLSISPPEGQPQVRGSKVNLVVSQGRPTVPKINAGLSVTEAERLITDAGLRPSRDDNANTFHDQVEKGKVVTTNPGPGTELSVNAPVVLVLSKGPAPKPVPDVTGKTKDEAFQLLRAQGLQPVDAPQEFSAQVDAGRVVRTDPPAGAVIPAGDSTQVSVVLSNAVTVPEVRGLTVSAARNALQALGLQVEVQQFFQGQDTPVLDQSVPPNSRVQPGSKVVITAF